MNTKKLLGFILIPLLLVGGYFLINSFLFNGTKGKLITENGIKATYFAQADMEQKPAVVVIGGGQGGDYWANEFLGQGVVGLSLSYYRVQGLPSLMEEIPLEYFEKAITWLGQQAEVDPTKIMVMGASRNAELALVLASQFPDLISGVIAFAPSSISWSNAVLPFNSDTLKASWTYQGEDIPYLPMSKIKGTDSPIIKTLPYWKSGLKQADQYPEAIIPVEKIAGPILLLSGKDDQIWPSAFMSDMIENRLAKHEFAFDVENVQFENAGHLISRNLDYISQGRRAQMYVEGKAYEFGYGGTIEGDKAAIKQSWEKIKEFLVKVEGK